MLDRGSERLFDDCLRQVSSRWSWLVVGGVDYSVGRLHPGLMDAVQADQRDTTGTVERNIEAGQILSAERFTIGTVWNSRLFHTKIRGALVARNIFPVMF